MWWTVRSSATAKRHVRRSLMGFCDRYTASAQLVPKRHRPIVSASPAYPMRASAHEIGGWLACWLAKHSWPSCRSFIYRIWTFRHDMGGRRRSQRWQLRSHVWKGRRPLCGVIDFSWNLSTFLGMCARWSWLFPYDMTFNDKRRFLICTELSCDSSSRNFHQGICFCEPRHDY